jgi:hypothetical protein
MQAAPAPPQLVLKKESIAKRNPFSECPISIDQSVDFHDRSTTNPHQIGGGFLLAKRNHPIDQPTTKTIGMRRNRDNFITNSYTYRFNLVDRCNSRDLGSVDS